ncbi:hypothetical protein [Acinetobacter sp. HY1485]|uniref:hypothetical protein n=1 Tax=Acinetobacter sp. HY1485 TaxID=2970918 RepID=UPI0022B97B1E|nr:hypothetical protein [Acinetobacter sp. HY1485]
MKKHKRYFKRKVHVNNKITISWEDLIDSTIDAVHLPNVTSKICPIKNLEIEDEVYFMFENDVFSNMLKFDNIKDLVEILDNYYIFNKNADYIIVYESYETLFGGRLAKEWLKEIKDYWKV